MGDATTGFFDAMAASYDVLEPWYEHLYAELHRILRSTLSPAAHGARALDAGCGTGFQTAILAELGYQPYGLDVSVASLSVARGRLPASHFVCGDLGRLGSSHRRVPGTLRSGSRLASSRVAFLLGREALRPVGKGLLERLAELLPPLR